MKYAKSKPFSFLYLLGSLGLFLFVLYLILFFSRASLMGTTTSTLIRRYALGLLFDGVLPVLFTVLGAGAYW